MRFELSEHAKRKLMERSIPEAAVGAVLSAPDAVIPQDEELTIYQSQLDLGSGTMWLVRVVVNDKLDPPVIVTAYATRDLGRYRRHP